MAKVSLQQFFDLAQTMRNDATQRPSGDKTTFQFGADGSLASHEWKLYTTRGRVYNETNQKLRQDLYDALTAKLGPLEKLDADTKKLLKLDDFQAKNGKVTSDRPLTLRRIEAIKRVVEGKMQAPAEQTKLSGRPEFTDEMKAANDRANGPDAEVPEALPTEETACDTYNYPNTEVVRNAVQAGKSNKEKYKFTGSNLHATLVYGFKEGGRDYSATIMPRQQLLASHGCKTQDMAQPLNNLFTTTFKKGDQELVTLNRFGSVSTTNEMRAQHCRDLAIQTFLSNSKLVAEAQDGGTIDLPIYRVNMALEDPKEAQDAADRKDGYKVTLTFRPEGADKDVTVTLNAVEHSTYCAVDSYYKGNEVVLSEAQLNSTRAAIESLGTEKDRVLADPKTEDATKAEINKLWSEIQREKAILLDNDAKYKDGFKCSKDMLRLGSAFALLAAKLGHVPAVNCNMGRDRTGIMTNEVQLLAFCLDNGEEIGAIGSRRNVALRTRLLLRSGASDIAPLTNLGGFGVNLSQSDDNPKTLFEDRTEDFVKNGYTLKLSDLDAEGEVREIEADKEAALEDEISAFKDHIAAHLADTLERCRTILPESLPDGVGQFPKRNQEYFLVHLNRAIGKHLHDNPASLALVRNAEDKLSALETLLSDTPELKASLAKDFFSESCRQLKDRAEDELSAALRTLVKGVPGLDDPRIDTGDLSKACDELVFGENDTTASVKAKFAQLKEEALAERSAVLIELRDTPTLAQNPALRAALISDNLDAPGLKAGELEDVLTFVQGLDLKASGKNPDDAVKMFTDIAKAVAQKTDGKSDAYKKAVSIGIAHTYAKELIALNDVVSDDVEMDGDVRGFLDSLAEDMPQQES